MVAGRMGSPATTDEPRKPGRVVVNAGWLYLDQGLRAIFMLVTFSAVTRYLGPGGFGVLSYAVAFPALFLPWATLGLDYVVVQELVRRPADRQKILGTAALLLLGSTVASLGGAVAGMSLLAADHPARPLIWITIFSLLGQPWQVMDFYFQSRVAARYTVITRLAASIVGNGMRLWLVAEGAALSWFAGVFVFETVLAAVGLLVAYHASRGEPIRPWKDKDRAEAKRLMGAAWPLMAGGVAMAFYLRFDQLLLERLAGPAVLGVYAAAVRLGDAAQFVTYALIMSYFPRFVAAHAEGGPAFEAACERFFLRITWLAIAVAVGVTVLAPWITAGLLGARFAGSAEVLVWLVWANVFAAQIGVRGKWFLVEGWQMYSLAFFGVGAVCHLAGVWWLAPRHGAVGAAISFCVAQAVMAVLAPLMFAKTRLAAKAAARSFWPAKLWR